MAKLTDRPDLKSAAGGAAQALKDDAGCTAQRADELVEAVAQAAAEEALAIVAGSAEVTASITDTRLARLRRILDALGKTAPAPTSYEVGAIFRITPTQGRTLLRTYQARYSSDFRSRMQSGIKAAAAKGKKTGGLGSAKFAFEFPDAATLEYASDRLRRQGFERGLSVDREKLTLKVDAGVKVNNLDAKAFLSK